MKNDAGKGWHLTPLRGVINMNKKQPGLQEGESGKASLRMYDLKEKAKGTAPLKARCTWEIRSHETSRAGRPS